MLLRPDSAIAFLRERRAEDLKVLALLPIAAGIADTANGHERQLYEAIADRLDSAADTWHASADGMDSRRDRRRINDYRDIADMARDAARHMRTLAKRTENGTDAR